MRIALQQQSGAWIEAKPAKPNTIEGKKKTKMRKLFDFK